MPFVRRSSPLPFACGAEILFTTRTFSGTRAFSLRTGLPRDFASTTVFVFAFTFAVMYFLTSFASIWQKLCHLISNILLKTFAYSFKWDPLEDRVEETLDHDLLGFRLWDAA